ncbi:MAG TPA: dihydroorotate dehydrogenase [Gemmatimonadales bacterium]|nr:dihydroorotate dehydrogenase [Gemmatimonadales bacterium]
MAAQSLARDIVGQRFQNPVLLAAGTAGFGRELDGVMQLDRLGGVVTKAVSRAPRKGNPPPRVAEFAAGMLNSVGLANPGLDEVRRDQLPWLARRLSSARILVNVVGFTMEEYAEVVAGLDDVTGIAAYELNLSCPNTSAGGIEFGADANCVKKIVTLCRVRTRRPLFAKLSPVLPDIAGMAVVARDAGADGITVVNTVPGLLHHGAGPARLGNAQGGVSGPALLPIGVLAAARVVERTGGSTPVIGVGGIRSAADVREYLRVGASLVAIGTAALADPRLPERVIHDLERGHG